MLVKLMLRLAGGGFSNADPSIEWPKSVYEQILSLKNCYAKHGEAFLYRSIETDLLAHILIAVSGMPLNELLSKELWQPMGAEEDGFFTVDPSGYSLASGGFNVPKGFGKGLLSFILMTASKIRSVLFLQIG